MRKIFTSPIVLALMGIFLIFNTVVILSQSARNHELRVLTGMVERYRHEINDETLANWEAEHETIQYTTKLGRNLFYKKVIASIMAAIMITTIQLGVIFTLYSRQGTSMFFPADINSFFSADHISWLDITFGQYIWLTIGLVYVIGVIMALLIPFLSRLSPNYLTVIGIQIPSVLILINRLFEYLIITPTSIIFPPYLVPSIYAGLIFLVVWITVIQWLREKKIDINIK